MSGRWRSVFVVWCACAAVSHLLVASQPRAGTPAPNILIIHADDLGYGDLSAYGQARFETPALDRLAREGIRFTHYYAGSTVCAPSRAALMTGLHTGHAWIRGNGDFPLRAEDVTVAMVLREAGYRTAVIGKWGLGRPGSAGQPDQKGFEYSFGFLDHRHAHRQFTDHLYRNAERVATDIDGEYVNDLFTKEAAAFIERPDPRPFFVYLNYTVPHAELRVPDESLEPFRGRFPEQAFVNEKADARASGPDGTSLGYRSQPTPRAAFAAMITRLDRDIGRLAGVLQARGLDGRTLLLFTSDNGPHKEGGADPVFFKSSGGLRGIKRDLYEGGIRVPMIARWPGAVPAGRISDHVWAHWDILPTLADLAGAGAPRGLDGISMARALRGEPQPAHEFLYWEFHERGFQQAARMGPWKAVRLQKDAPLELYNLDADPFEQRDVAAIQPDAVARIENYLRTARTESSLWPVLARKPANQPGETADTTELTRLEHVWNEAHVRGDAEALDRLWSDDFVVTVPGMTVLTKAAAIGVWRSGKMKFQRYETSDLRVRVYTDAAVVTGRLRRTRHFNDREIDDDWRFTKVYVRSAGRWQVVAFHASTVAQ